MPDQVTVIGASGALGFGLALRLAVAGVPVVIGSRDAGPRRGGRRAGARAGAGGASVRGLANGPAAEASEVVFLCVPFRNQSETLTNLKKHLREGQLAGRRDRAAGRRRVRQGDAHARRLAGLGGAAGGRDGAGRRPRRRRAAHRQRARAADLDATLDEDVLVCGDRRADKARAAALIELDPRPALRRRRAAGAGAHRRVADRAADRRQRPLQDARGHPAHRARPTRPW